MNSQSVPQGTLASEPGRFARQQGEPDQDEQEQERPLDEYDLEEFEEGQPDDPETRR